MSSNLFLVQILGHPNVTCHYIDDFYTFLCLLHFTVIVSSYTFVFRYNIFRYLLCHTISVSKSKFSRVTSYLPWNVRLYTVPR